MWSITTVGPCALGDHHSTPLALLAGKGEGVWRDARLRGERAKDPRGASKSPQTTQWGVSIADYGVVTCVVVSNF